MKKSLLASIFASTICCFTMYSKAQDAMSSPVAYMNAINESETLMNKSYMTYVSAAAHSSRKRKIEKLRNQAVESILNCQSALTYLPPYKTDNSLRQSSLDYVKLCYKVFNDDYAHIVNMEDIAERSYDEMQAFLLLQQATDDTLQAAVKRMDKAERAFANKYLITLTDQKTELSDKMEKTGKLTAYRNRVFLLFYKCNWEDGQLTDAVNQKNATKIEQCRNALDKYAIEGIAALDTTQDFDNDNALKAACRQALDFYKQEAETQAPTLTDYFLKTQNFDKMKAAMDAKSPDQRTKQDIDNFNNAVKDINEAVNAFNQTNNDLNTGRNNAVNNWNGADKNFTDTHTPYYN